MLQARERIEHWWNMAYRRPDDETVASRFADEARASLPGLAQAAGPIELDDVFGAMRCRG
jgi:hypothetical protein